MRNVVVPLFVLSFSESLVGATKTGVFLDVSPVAVQDGFHPGRSGDIILQPLPRPQSDARAFFFEMPTAAGVPESTNNPEISLYNVVDVVADGLGLPPFNRSFERPDWLAPHGFERPKANLFISLEAIGDRLLDSGFVTLSFLRSPPRAVTAKVNECPYPSNSVSWSASLATGTSPSRHGIVGPQWLSRDSSHVKAYSAAGPVLRGNLADSLAQTFEGESLVVSLSGSKQLADVHA